MTDQEAERFVETAHSLDAVVAVLTETLHRNVCVEPFDSCDWWAEIELAPCRDDKGRWKYLGHEREIATALASAGMLSRGQR